MNIGDKIHALITIQKIKNGVPTVMEINGRNYILQQQEGKGVKRCQALK